MLQEIRDDLEGWLGENEASVLRAADPERLRRSYPRAVSRESWRAADDAVTAAGARGDADLLARHTALRGLAARLWLAEEEKEEAAAARARLEAARGRLPDGQETDASGLAVLRGTSPTREMRAAAAEALERAHEAALEPFRELLRRRRERAQQAGAQDAADLVQRLDGVDLRALAGDVAGFLAATRDPYRENLDWTLRRHGASLAAAAPHDLDWARFDLRRTLPATSEAMRPALEQLLTGCGLDPSAGGRLRRITSPAGGNLLIRRRVPGEVTVALAPADGLAGWAAALSTWGRGLAAAGTAGTLPFEFRCAGDRAVPAAWGELLALPLADPGWLTRALGVARPRDGARELAALDLARLRRTAGLFLAELDQAGGASEADARLHLSEATLLRESPSAVLREGSPWLETAHAVRARAGALALDSLLAARFDSWHRNPESGRLLLPAFSLGRSLPLGELLRSLGVAAPLFDAAAAACAARLS